MVTNKVADPRKRSLEFGRIYYRVSVDEVDIVALRCKFRDITAGEIRKDCTEQKASRQNVARRGKRLVGTIKVAQVDLPSFQRLARSTARASRSNRVTYSPRRASASAVHAPMIPAPRTAIWRFAGLFKEALILH